MNIFIKYLYELIAYLLEVGDKIVTAIITPTWQQLCLIISLLIIICFRKKIGNLLDRVKLISKSKVEFPPFQMVAENPKITSIDYEDLDLPMTALNNVNIIKKDIEEKGYKDSLKIQEVLIKDLASLYFWLRCERIYSMIFGSQLHLLNLLKIQTLTETDVARHFENVSKLYPDAFLGWNVELYMNYLFESELITFEEQTYKLTTLGSDFLTWFQHSGLIKNKIL